VSIKLRLYFLERENHYKLEIAFIKNRCLPQLPKLMVHIVHVLQQNPPTINVLAKLGEKA
jgi:hypothetical protein